MKSYSNRKYRIALLSFFLVTLGYGITHFSDRLKDSYFTFVGAIGTILTLYGAANVGNKWVLAKNGILTPTDSDTMVVMNPKNQIVSVPPTTDPINNVKVVLPASAKPDTTKGEEVHTSGA